MDIPLLPESQEDRHLAHLLALKPAYDITEKQAAARMNIINSPALPSSSGLITSFGGLKTERLLSQSRPLSRSILGISIKSLSGKNVTKSKTSATVASLKEIDKSTKNDNIINDVSVIENNISIVDGLVEKVQSTNYNDAVEKDISSDDAIVIAKDITTNNYDGIVTEKDVYFTEKDTTNDGDVIEKDTPITTDNEALVGENDSHVEIDTNKRKIENYEDDSCTNKKQKISLVCDYDSTSSSDS